MLREMDYGEADRILTLLTPAGKLQALARGIRRATSRKAGQLGLFYHAELMLARGRNLDTITQAQSIETFEGIRADLWRFSYACYAAELAERFAQEGEEDLLTFELALRMLRWCSEGANLRLGMRYLEMRLLAQGGYKPELFRCLACHQEVSPQPNYFSAEQGGILCARCGEGQPRARAVSVNAQKVLRFLQTRDEAAVRALSIGDATQEEVEALLQRYLEFVLERELKSCDFIRRLRRELGTGGQGG